MPAKVGASEGDPGPEDLRLAGGLELPPALCEAELLRQAEAEQADPDVLGRALLNEIVSFWRQSRSWNDVAEELRFTADSLDPDTDFEFMRP